jgi:radical SAM protein (TIGR04043 family)
MPKLKPTQSNQFTPELLRDIYHLKTRLLVNGLKIADEFERSIKNFGVEFTKGRKGGAGPAGGRYFLFENNSLVNVPIWGSESENSDYVLAKVIKRDPMKPEYLYCLIINQKTNEKLENLRLIPIFENYNYEVNIDNTINKQIALIHGDKCLASTIVQECKYWCEGKQCKFCGIELSLKNKETIKLKTPDQLIKSIEYAMKLGLCENITLTSGTLDTPDKGADYYLNVVRAIKKRFPKLGIHIQIEPFSDLHLLQDLKEAGVNTLGVHLEIPNDELRFNYCPGKSEIPRKTFEEFWMQAVKIFGKGDVTTFILTGFGENIQELKDYCDKIISWGIIPVVVPVRHIEGTRFQKQTTNAEDLIEIYDSVAKSFIKHQLNPLKTKAGCVRCSGCSAILDAYEYFSRILK